MSDEERRRKSDEALYRFEGKLDAILHTQSDMHAKQEVIRTKVEVIEAETKKTNGRVTKLEDGCVEMNRWKDIKTGELKVVSWILGVIIVALIGAWVKVLF